MVQCYVAASLSKKKITPTMLEIKGHLKKKPINAGFKPLDI